MIDLQESKKEKLTSDNKRGGEIFGDYPSCGCSTGKRREVIAGPDWIYIDRCERCRSAPVYLSRKALEIFTASMDREDAKYLSHKTL